MSLRPHDRTLDDLLDSLAKARPEHGDTFRAAAEGVRAIFSDDLPRVVVTTGWDADPVVLELETALQSISAARKRLDGTEDAVHEILGLLRRRLHRESKR